MEEEIILHIGTRIRYFRRKQHLSQEEVAHRVGTSQSYLGKVERGVVVVGVEMLQKIAIALDVDLVQFFQKPEFHDEVVKDKIFEIVKKATPKERRIILNIVDGVVN